MLRLGLGGEAGGEAEEEEEEEEERQGRGGDIVDMEERACLREG